jgi:hypothetical protein
MKPAPFSSIADDGTTTTTTDNRRAWPRIPAAQIPQLSATLTTGPDIRLIDISRGGALFECSKRLVPASAVALRLVTPDGTHIVRGRVVRSRIVRMERGGLGYQAAVAFNEALSDFIDEPGAKTPAPAAAGHAASPPAPAPPVTVVAPADPATAPADPAGDPTPADDNEEPWAPPIMTLTASVVQSSDELREMFNGNNW